MTTQEHVSGWLKNYAEKANKHGFVVGVSGGIDSAVTSTLCALTGLTTVCILLPIWQDLDQHDRGYKHISWLMKNHKNVWTNTLDLTEAFEEFKNSIPINTTNLALACTRSRLRMTALYAVATTMNLLVVGTGNLVEDYGIGFFTKYGDGGVDLSPIGKLTKSEVWQLGKDLGISKEIIDATPTDGLWSDNRSDENQIGASYPELEWAMSFLEETDGHFNPKDLTPRQNEVIAIYLNFHNKNAHKMEMPPICPKL